MTAVDGDGIDEDLTRTVSVAMLAAARAGEQFSRMTQAAAREREARSAGDTAQAQRQLAAHTESAKAYFEVVTRPEYLSVATDEQIREVARQAEAWRERLPEAQRASDAASRELGARQPGDLEERSAVLAAEGEAADRRAGADRSDPERGDDAAGLESLSGSEAATERSTRRIRSGQEAVATAEVAQARPAREAPGSFPRRRSRRSARQPIRGRSAGVER